MNNLLKLWKAIGRLADFLDQAIDRGREHLELHELVEVRVKGLEDRTNGKVEKARPAK